MVTNKFRKIKFLPLVTKPYVCPVANIEFIGTCCNTGCPANLANKRNLASGCFFEKGQSNVIDVARWNKMSTHETKRKYQKGMRQLEKFVMFYNFVQNCREVTHKSCPNCGASNQHNLACLNVTRCNKRQKLFNTYSSRFPFNVAPLNVSKAEFWLAIRAEKLMAILPEKLINKANLLTLEKS